MKCPSADREEGVVLPIKSYCRMQRALSSLGLFILSQLNIMNYMVKVHSKYEYSTL